MTDHMSAAEYQRFLNTGKLPKRMQSDSGKTISQAEINYENFYIKPKVASGEIISYESQRTFVLYEGTAEQKKIIYTPDFVIQYAGRNKKVAIEVKGEQIRKWQREFPMKKARFLELYGDEYEFEIVASEDWSR